MGTVLGIRREPCSVCPYRQDCPSGVWSIEDYAKLPPYDNETGEQPAAGFLCHATPEWLCHGWAVVGGWDLLGLRLMALLHRAVEFVVPAPYVPLWASHTAAAEHGIEAMTRVELPDEAVDAIRRLQRKYPRLRDGGS